MYAVFSLLLFFLCHLVETHSINVARNKPATQISTYNQWTLRWLASHAVDGDKTCTDPPTWQHYSATKADSEANDWWRVDLQSRYDISHVVVYGKPTDANGQLTGFRLYLTENPVDSPNPSTSIYNNTDYGNGVFNVTTTKTARYVMLAQPKWYRRIVLCEVEVYVRGFNLCDRLRNRVITRQSSIFQNSPNFNSSNAIDGKANYDVNHCGCCSVTKRTPSPSWWQIDLRNKYTVHRVEIFGRSDTGQSNEQLEYATIQAGNKSMDTSIYSGHLLYTVPTITNSTHFVHNLNSPVTAQFFIIKLQNEILVLCEFILYGKESFCDVGKFGQNCSLNCHCADRRVCDSVDGMCQTQGCLTGWTGPACDKECPHRLFGQNCAGKCHCYGNTTCNNVNGICTAGYCEPGWQGPSCNQECPYRRFGQNCTGECHCFGNTTCSKINGICTVGYCEPGWQGPSCSQECPYRRFGHNCTIECHCFGNTTCNNINGICTVGYCESGWQGQNCSQVCPFRSFDKNCTSRCHCYNKTGCDHIDGKCRIGYCDPGWHGNTCSEVCPYRTFGQNCSAVCHCFNNTTCRPTDGVCNIEYCEAGWQGSTCNQVCPFRSFGQNCSAECHCFNNTTCRTTDGFCNVGFCEAGWQGSNCSQACPFGRYGQNCTDECHCFNKTTCNETNGVCDVGSCEPGWQGPKCSQVCSRGKFGENCSRTCHCANATECDTANGICLAGRCDPGWQGITCSEAGNILLRIRDQVSTQMSSVAKNWTSDRAIDGLVGPDPDKCHCCSGTENAELSWWRLDFGKLIPIKMVTIYGRNQENNYQHLKGFKLYLTNETLQNEPAANTNTSTKTVSMGNTFDITVPNTLARYLTITRPGVLTICEVLVFEGECREGTYGDECQQECHCADNKRCTRTSGKCQTSICKTGWRGAACDEECPQNSFGDECRENCFCAEGTCTSSYGICSSGCKPGYHGPHCNIEGNVQKNEEISSNIATTIGASVGGSVVFLFIIVSVGFLLKKYRSKQRHPEEHKSVYAIPAPNTVSSENSEYDTLDNFEDARRDYENTGL